MYAPSPALQSSSPSLWLLSPPLLYTSLTGHSPRAQRRCHTGWVSCIPYPGSARSPAPRGAVPGRSSNKKGETEAGLGGRRQRERGLGGGHTCFQRVPQLCVFSQAKECLKKKKIHTPPPSPKTPSEQFFSLFPKASETLVWDAGTEEGFQRS